MKARAELQVGRLLSMRSVFAIFASTGALSCGPNSVSDADVVTLEVCPDESCKKVADGQSPLAITTCIAEDVEERKTDLEFTLTATAGTWAGTNPAASTTTGTFGGSRCVTRDWVPPRTAGSVRIDSEVAGFHAEDTVELAPAPLAAIEVTPAPAFLNATKATTVVLNTVVRAKSGKTSTGTTVTYSIDGREPSGAAVVLFPSSAELDSAQKATTTLSVGPGTKSVSLEIEAVLPDGTIGKTETIELVSAAE